MIKNQFITLTLSILLTTLSFSQTPCTSSCNKIVFIIDNSGSISTSEFNQMKNSVTLVANSLLSNPFNEIAIVQYGSDNVPLMHLYHVTVPFTNNITTATTWNRAFSTGGTVNNQANQDHLPGSLYEMRTDNIWGSGMQLDLTTGCSVTFLLFTDANSTNSSCCSHLTNQGTFATTALPNFEEYNFLKNTYNAEFTVYHVVPNTAAQAAGAAIASVGGAYNGTIAANPTDPQGSGTLPRKFYTGSFIMTQAQVDALTTGINQIAVDFDNAANCQYQQTTFTNQTPSSAIASWNWNFGDGNSSTAQHPIHQYQAPGTYSVSLIATDTLGCSDTLVVPITILPELTASFQFNNACTDNLIPFQNTTTHGTTTNFSNYTWAWNFGDGNTSTSQNPSHQYTTEGNYDITLSVTSPEGCIDDTTISVTIHPDPVPNFSIQDVCLGNSVSGTNSSTISSGSIVNNTWTFGTSTYTTTDATHLYSNLGTYNVTLEVESDNGCISSITQPVSILDLPNVDLSYIIPCMGDSTIFQNNTTHSTISNLSNFSWAWSFGDGNTSTNQDPNNLYVLSGTYDVSLVATDPFGCSNSLDTTITILPEVMPNFQMSDACPNVSIIFQNNTTHGNVTDFTNYLWAWDFGDGNTSTDQDPSHPYLADGNYDVVLSVVSPEGCQKDTTITVTINPNPVADFTAPDACYGDSVYAVNNSTVSSGSIANSTWSFEQTTYNSTDATHLYGAVGTYTISLLVESDNGCLDSIDQTVDILELPLVDFINLNPCTDDLTNFQNNTTHENVTNFSNYTWAWDFGNGNTSNVQNPSHAFGGFGDFNVNLLVTAPNGCFSDSTILIGVYPFPDASFTVDNICVGETISGINTSTVELGTITTNFWTLGSEFETSVNADFASQTHGIFDITLQVQSSYGCSDVVTNQVVVYEMPIADFTFDQNAINAGSTVIFYNESYNATNFSWTIDGVEIDSTFDFWYTLPDDYGRAYTVCLIVHNASNCLDTICRNIALNDEIVVFVPNSFTPNGDEYNNSWGFHVIGIDEADFQVKIYNRWGEVIWESHDTSAEWDGTYNGSIVQDGVYTWVMDVKARHNDFRDTYRGHINVLK